MTTPANSPSLPSLPRKPAACAIAWDRNGRLLLHRRGGGDGRWSLPGGNIEADETLDQCVVREVKEETGFDVRVIRLTGVYSDPAHTTIRYADGSAVAYVTAAFECKVIGGSRKLSDESTDVDFFDPKKLPEPFMPNHVPRLADALKKREAAFYR